MGEISKEVFDREMRMCENLSRTRGGKCAWGKCKDCGVVLLLHKLHKGELIEDSKEIKKTRDKIIS